MRNDRGSLLALYRRLIELRRGEAALGAGTQEMWICEPPILAYRRRVEDYALGVALNFGAETQHVRLDGQRGRVRLSTFLDRDGEACGSTLELRGDEGVIVELEPAPTRARVHRAPSRAST
jgi:alpha-glucosidase